MKYPWRTSYDPWFPDHLKYPEHTMYEAVSETAEKYESETALYYFNSQMTYAELMHEIDKASKALRADGFDPKDVVTICLPNIPQAVILFYAINRMGGICNMLHPLSPAAEIVETMEKTNSPCLLYTSFTSELTVDRTLFVLSWETPIYKITVCDVVGLIVASVDRRGDPHFCLFIRFGHSLTPHRMWRAKRAPATKFVLYWGQL